jgi:O-antigen/teichoic acid export membrane protein
MYSAKFSSSTELLSWFVLGVFGQVINFPLGFIQRAKGSKRWIYIGQTEANIVLLILSITAVNIMGLNGLGKAYVAHTIIHGLVVYWIAFRLSRFHWRKESYQILGISLILMVLAFNLHYHKVSINSLFAGFLLSILTFLITLRGISSRIEKNNKILSKICKYRIGKIVCGLK